MEVSPGRQRLLDTYPVIHEISRSGSGPVVMLLQFRRGGFVTISVGGDVYDLIEPTTSFVTRLLELFNRFVHEKPASAEAFLELYREVHHGTS